MNEFHFKEKKTITVWEVSVQATLLDFHQLVKLSAGFRVRRVSIFDKLPLMHELSKERSIKCPSALICAGLGLQRSLAGLIKTQIACERDRWALDDDPPCPLLTNLNPENSRIRIMPLLHYLIHSYHFYSSLRLFNPSGTIRSTSTRLLFVSEN